jgi:hypothetical protein
VDARLIAGCLLVVASVGIGARVVEHAQDRIQVMAFTRDLAAGATVQGGDVQPVRVGLSTRQASVYITRAGAINGRQLVRPVSRGEFVTHDSLRASAETLTIVVPLAAGAAPQLHRGQRIAVWAAAKDCDLSLLIADATVQSADQARGAFGASDAQNQQVVLTLPDADAQRVVRALAQDDVALRAGIVSGPARVQESSAPVAAMPCTSPAR